MTSLGNYYLDFFGATNPFWLQTEQTIRPIQPTTPVILIASKHYDTQILFTALLKNWSFEPVEASNFEDSLNLIETEKPSVILLDCISSINESVEEIKLFKTNKLSYKIPIIAFSEISGTAYKNQILKAGADECLLKPLNFACLETLIQEKVTQFNFDFGGLR